MSDPENNSEHPDFAQFVCMFSREMNDWELAFTTELSECRNPYVHERDQEVRAKYQKLYAEIFERYCTQKKRVYGGPDAPRSCGFPTKYQGVDERTLIGVEPRNRNRVEVFFQTDGPVVDYKFMFVVLQKSGVWRIDGYKYQFKGEEKWEIGIL